LITLVISILFGNSFLSNKEKEGFVSFGYTNANNTTVYIPQYSKDSNKKVIYLYDNLYFDGLNANLIEVDSTYGGNVRVNGSTVSGNISINDSTGISISNIYITTRQGNTVSYSTIKNNQNDIESVDTNESKTSLTQLNTDYTYLTRCPTISTIANYKYQVFYISWENDTYMHLIGLDPTAVSGNNIRSFYYKNVDNTMHYVDFTNTAYIPQYSQTHLSNEDPNNGKIYKDAIYNKNIYQITKYVKYDITNGNLLVLNPTSNTYLMYNRSTGRIIETANSGLVENLTSFVSWIVSDNNNGMVLVMCYGVYTVVAIINSVQNTKYYNLSYCVRFTDVEVHLSSNTKNNLNINSYNVDVSMNDSEKLHCHDELSCKWYYYFKTIGNDPSVLFSNDYIRKTQIVPPVCPTCPTCPSRGVCTDCGGNGGSGTKNTSSNNGSDDNDDSDGNIVTDAVGGAVDLTKETVGGAVNLAKETVGGAVNLAKDTVGGAVDLIKGDKDDDDSSSEDPYYYQGGAHYIRSGYLPSTRAHYLDQYSYYGALKPKGDNFMPVTADFSSFRK
jgi:hypothetical protein